MIVLNIFPTGYAEEEFWTSCYKLLIIAMFLMASFVFVLGGGPESGRYGEYYGARLFYDPGSFPNGFKGLCSVFVTAAFSFAGTELVGRKFCISNFPCINLTLMPLRIVAATEHPNPTKAMPSAIKVCPKGGCGSI